MLCCWNYDNQLVSWQPVFDVSSLTVFLMQWCIAFDVL